MEEGGEGESGRVVILSSPGVGHLIPVIELAKRLTLSRLSVTIVTVSIDSCTNQIKVSPPTISHIPLPPVPSRDFPHNSKIETRISLAVKSSVPHLRHILSNGKRVAALVVDIFGGDAYDVAAEFDVPTFMFMTSTFTLVSLCLCLQEPSCHYQQPIKAPGCMPLGIEDMPDPLKDPSDEAYAWVLHHFRRHRRAKGILGNSSLDLEAKAIRALEEEVEDCPPIYPVGPLIRPYDDVGDKHWCTMMKWMDEQARGSVLFVCFGSGGTLCAEQQRELAWGLEMSEERFLWVARRPYEEEAGGKFFSAAKGDDGGQEAEAALGLPEGFRERNKGTGLVVLESWVPQLQILKHEATGGFLSHCGWNSTLESIVHGVPIIAWPLYAEQRMNALMLVHHLKVALTPSSSASNHPNKIVIRREEIAKAVKCLMKGEEGKCVRKRMGELKDACSRALEMDGSSHMAFTDLVRAWNASRVATTTS